MVEKILTISLCTIGYCCTFWQGMIFERIGDWLELSLPEWINKPLWQCYICCCMWFGSLVYWVLFGDSITQWLVCCIGAMGVNAITNELIKNDEDI